MDLVLLTFFNQTVAHPILDGLMITLTTAGFAVLPVLGLVFLFPRQQRRVGLAILAALIVSLGLTLVFQHLALRPRPQAVRLVLTQPNFPSFPSGHAAGAFGVALVLMLAYHHARWGLVALVGASLIAFSRVYLGQHYPSDILGGTVLGAATGAACYGVIVARRPGQLAWQWLVWLQIAVALVVTQMAYLDVLPGHLLRWPFADKVFHFLLIGSIAFWLNLWLNGRRMPLGSWSVPLALLIPFGIALLEEGIQYFSPVRSASFSDLISDLAGLVFFWWLSQIVINKRVTVEDSPS